jgi:NAD(P)H-hydrate epimerase
MHKVVTTAQMREIDRLTTEKYGIPSLQLMENAARSVTDAITDYFGDVTGLKALVACGPGNNGGDGAAIARQLVYAGAKVTVIFTKTIQEAKSDSRTNFERLAELASRSSEENDLLIFQCPDSDSWRKFVEAHPAFDPDVVVDAVFGTGLTRPLSDHYRSVLGFLQHWSREIERPLLVAVDIPSGLNSDSQSLMDGNINADITVTFTAPKIANVIPPASRFNGELVIVDIGSPQALIDEFDSTLYLTTEDDARSFLLSTRYLPGSFKNSHGHALVIAGSRDYLGAPVLCGDAAMQSGAGLVTVATPASALFGVAPRLMPEVITAALAETDGGAVSLEAKHQVEKLAQRADVIAAGPGLTASDEGSRSFMRWLVENRRQPLVIDADGLNALSPWPGDLKGTNELPIVLTPHPGEMRRLLGVDDPGDEPWKAAAEFAERQRLIVVLKGERTLVISPEGDVFINPTGNPGVGTAGAGDTMTGVIAGFLAQDLATHRDGADVLTTVRAAVYICGMAADLAANHIGMRAMTASDIRTHLSAAICELAPESEFPLP